MPTFEFHSKKNLIGIELKIKSFKISIDLAFTSTFSCKSKFWTISGSPFSTAICNAVLLKFKY